MAGKQRRDSRGRFAGGGGGMGGSLGRGMKSGARRAMGFPTGQVKKQKAPSTPAQIARRKQMIREGITVAAGVAVAGYITYGKVPVLSLPTRNKPYNKFQKAARNATWQVSPANPSGVGVKAAQGGYAIIRTIMKQANL